MHKRGFWKTRFGFYLAAIGSACGLGNLWRFPYVVGENGGGAFVLLYLIVAVVIGLPLLIGELSLGKFTRRSVLSATSYIDGIHQHGNRFVWVGRAAVVLSLIVLSYYAVISGWVLHFTTQFLVGVFSPESFAQRGNMEVLLNNGWLQMGLASVHLLLTVGIVLKGVQEGLEKWIGYMMPVFSVLLVALVFKSLSLSNSANAFRFLFYPDFSKLTWSSLIHAVGHVCFTLSVGFGTMVTFGSYLRDADHIPTAGARVTIVDTLLSLFAVLILFPVALGASNTPLTDPGLLFEVLPRFLSQLQGGVVFGIAFFICLYLAALGASIGLLEVIVSNWVDRSKVSRSFATWITGGAAFVLGGIAAVVSAYMRGMRLEGRSFLEVMDSLLINWCLPVVALGLSLVVSLGIKTVEKEKLFVDQNKIASVALFPHWLVMIRWMAPVVIGVALLLQVVGLILTGI